MQYRQIEPIAPLKPYIRYFGLLENDDAFDELVTFKIIADGCPGLIFQENADCFFDKGNQRLPQLFLHGISTRHSQKTSRGHYRNLGVYFHPGALRSIFGINAHALTNQYYPLDDIVRNTLTEQLLHCADGAARIAVLSEFFLQQLAVNGHRENAQTNFAIDKIKGSAANISLSTLQTSLHISERGLERLFNAHVGISPKLFCRIERFQQTLNAIRNKRFEHLTAIAYAYDYADQSHFIREFKEFAGINPKHYLSHTREQAINFPEYHP